MSSRSEIDRRTFMKVGSGLLAAGLGPSVNAEANHPATKPTKSLAEAPALTEEPYTVKWYPFTGHPDSDTCWSLSVGPDGRIYAAACAETVPGGVVKPVRYNEQRDDLDYLFDLAEKVDDPRDSGRASQLKIPYSFVPSMHDGVLYMATHLSGPPIDLPVYSPWYSWHDPKRCFRGSAVLPFDTSTDKVLSWDTLLPKDGSRCLLPRPHRGLLHPARYPRDHFIIYDLRTRKRRDVGRISSINPQALFLDKRHRVCTSSDYGRLVRYTPETDRLEISPGLLARHLNYQNAGHSVFYDLPPSPE